jgi:hypothetical protein
MYNSVQYGQNEYNESDTSLVATDEQSDAPEISIGLENEDKPTGVSVIK